MNDGEPVELTSAYVELARSLAAVLRHDFGLGRTERAVVAIAGESGSGTSVTASCLVRELNAGGLATVVLHQDDYFVRPPRANHAFRCLDLVHVGPHEVDLALLGSHVAAFRAGLDDVAAPRVDYPSDSFLAQRLDFAHAAVLIVEGTYVLRLADAVASSPRQTWPRPHAQIDTTQIASGTRTVTPRTDRERCGSSRAG